MTKDKKNLKNESEEEITKELNKKNNKEEIKLILQKNQIKKKQQKN